jgi:hypothetical protein
MTQALYESIVMVLTLIIAGGVAVIIVIMAIAALAMFYEGVRDALRK